MGNNPVNGIDPDGQWVEFVIGAAMGGFSGWMTGKAKGATGWSMAGYIVGGAAIGAVTAGIGNYVGSATAAWGTIGSGMASGAAAGFVGGGLNSTLAGGNFWQGAGRGALWGGVIGGVGSYLNEAYTDWRIEQDMFSSKYALAQQGDPLYKGGTLNEVVITAKRNAGLQMSLAGQARGQMIGAFAANMGSVVGSWPPYSHTGAVTPSYPEAMFMPIPKIGFGGNVAVQYTKSNMQLGQQMHKAYKAGMADGINTFKEFRGIKGIRPDYVDFGTKTIYELKPFNPRAIQQGTRQLSKYKALFEQQYGGKWNTVLNTY